MDLTIYFSVLAAVLTFGVIALTWFVVGYLSSLHRLFRRPKTPLEVDKLAKAVRERFEVQAQRIGYIDASDYLKECIKISKEQTYVDEFEEQVADFRKVWDSLRAMDRDKSERLYKALGENYSDFCWARNCLLFQREDAGFARFVVSYSTVEWSVINGLGYPVEMVREVLMLIRGLRNTTAQLLDNYEK